MRAQRNDGRRLPATAERQQVWEQVSVHWKVSLADWARRTREETERRRVPVEKS